MGTLNDLEQRYAGSTTGEGGSGRGVLADIGYGTIFGVTEAEPA